MMAKKAPNPTDKHVGARVRMRRMMLGMSQEKLGDALSLLYSGAFSARLSYDGREQITAVSAAAAALLDSALGAPLKART